MKTRKKFIKLAYNISYYDEDEVKWYQRLFFNPPREFRSTETRQSRKQAELIKIPNYKRFGKEFEVSAYDFRSSRVPA